MHRHKVKPRLSPKIQVQSLDKLVPHNKTNKYIFLLSTKREMMTNQAQIINSNKTEQALVIKEATTFLKLPLKIPMPGHPWIAPVQTTTINLHNSNHPHRGRMKETQLPQAWTNRATKSPKLWARTQLSGHLYFWKTWSKKFSGSFSIVMFCIS